MLDTKTHLTVTKYLKILLFIGLAWGQALSTISGNINASYNDSIAIRTCPDYVDSCLFICSDGYSNPCHPEDLYTITLDTSNSEETTLGSRYRIYFPWEHEGKTADKFTVTASWPCISPTAVYAGGNYAFWDLYGNEACPGTVQGSIWYGDDCEDDYGNIGSEDCIELVGRFCFVSGNTIDWEYDADQSISTDICDACWMSSAAWEDYDSEMYSDSLLSPGNCSVYDHCHHSEEDEVPCGVGYLDSEDTTSVSLMRDKINKTFNFFNNYPNPFNPVTTFGYELPEDSFVDVTVYDMLGNVVNNLVNANQSSGYKSIQWDATNNQGESVSAGVYLCKIQASDFSQTKKMILLK
jgi:hypothetical protein